MKTQREVYSDDASAINKLRNNGIAVDTGQRIVLFNPSKRNPGTALWGAIDYLKRFYRYGWAKIT